MKTRVYIDTNIFIYAILHDPYYGEICGKILRDMKYNIVDFYGSTFVAIELLGSLSKIDQHVASKATSLYLQLPHRILSISLKTIKIASIILQIINVKYDSIHLALMIENSIENIITNDTDDWFKIRDHFKDIVEKLEKNGFRIDLNEINVITPNNYEEFKNKLRI